MLKKLFSTLILTLVTASLFVLPIHAQEADFSWLPAEFELKSGRPGQKESAEIEFKNNIDLDVVFTGFTIVETVNSTDNVIARSIDNNLANNGRLNLTIDGLQDGKLVINKNSSAKYKFNFTFPDTLKSGNYLFRIVLSEDENAQMLAGDVNIAVKAEIVQPSVSTEQILIVIGILGVILLVVLIVFVVLRVLKKRRSSQEDEVE